MVVSQPVHAKVSGAPTTRVSPSIAERASELVNAVGVRRFQIRLLRPGTRPVSRIDIRCAGKLRAVVGLVSVYTGGRAPLAERANDQRVSVQRHRASEEIELPGVRGLDVRGLRPVAVKVT